MEKQNQILEAALQVKNRDGTAHRSSGGVIQIHPTATWPKLGDDGPGGREVEKLCEKYDEICGIARDGEGMTEKERLMTLKTGLKGSFKIQIAAFSNSFITGLTCVDTIVEQCKKDDTKFKLECEF